MDVVNVDTADTITLDDNANFLTGGAANIALAPNDSIRVCSNGTYWYHVEDKVAGVAGTPAGADTEIQYNNSGAFGASSKFTWNNTTNVLNVGDTGASAQVSTSGDELILAQSGDLFGQTSLSIQNRTGLNGALFRNHSIDLVDFGFLTSASKQLNLRIEGRNGYTMTGNDTVGEFQFVNPNGAGNPDHFMNVGAVRSAIYANNTEIVRITSTGMSIKQAADPTVALDVAGDIRHTGIIIDASDIRLKTDIRYLPEVKGDILARLQQIKGYQFRMKGDTSGQIEYGVIAQEIERVFPELVVTDKTAEGMKSVNYVGLIAPLIEATKELKSENDALKAKIADFDARMAALENNVDELKLFTGFGVSKASMGLLGIFALIIMSGIVVVIRRKTLAP